MMYSELLEYLGRGVTLTPYTNELDTMVNFLTTGDWSSRNDFIEYYLHGFNTNPMFDNEKMEESERYRQQGNSESRLQAIRSYTKAIFAAPKGSEELAFAYANRGITLQLCGYYAQAYDDCVCALEAGYPEQKWAKIILRQAHCALKMGDKTKVQQHASTLTSMQLNERLEDKLIDLWDALENMTENEEISETSDLNPSMAQSKTKIMEIPDKGRGIVATESFSANELIFEDRAIAFVTVHKNGKRIVCQNCVDTQIIAYPCDQCHTTVYCSLKCRQADAAIHAYECFGHKCHLYSNDRVLQLALRTTFPLMPEIVARLGHLPNAKAIWKQLVTPFNILSGRTRLAQTLSLVHHLDKMGSVELLNFAIAIQVLIVCLRRYGNLHRLFEGTKAGAAEWELITASLLLRSFGQAFANFYPIDTLFSDAEGDLPLVDDSFWSRPQHLLRGQLSQFAEANTIGVAVFPFFSLCNHTCDSSIIHKISGLRITCYAKTSIRADEEILTTYAIGCRSGTTDRRRKEFVRYSFECKCTKCTGPDAYDEFITQRCAYKDCSKIFVPRFTGHYVEAVKRGQDICTSCNRTNSNNMFEILKRQTQIDFRAADRSELLKVFDDVGKLYLHNNCIKVEFAMGIALALLEAHLQGFPINDRDFDKLEQIINVALVITEKQVGLYSLHYIALMSLMWDLYALRERPIEQSAIEAMLNSALLLLSDEFKAIVINYYDDYLKPLLLKARRYPRRVHFNK